MSPSKARHVAPSDALRFASRLPLAFIFRAFGAPFPLFVQSLTEVIDPQNCNNSQLSLRRMCSVSDVYYGVELVSHFLIQVALIYAEWETKG